jgi:hypothetical protein
LVLREISTDSIRELNIRFWMVPGDFLSELLQWIAPVTGSHQQRGQILDGFGTADQEHSLTGYRELVVTLSGRPCSLSCQHILPKDAHHPMLEHDHIHRRKIGGIESNIPTGL